jgi:hypothetical protein
VAISMGVGAQSFEVNRDGETILSGTSLKEVIDGCVCGLWPCVKAESPSGWRASLDPGGSVPTARQS